MLFYTVLNVKYVCWREYAVDEATLVLYLARPPQDHQRTVGVRNSPHI